MLDLAVFFVQENNRLKGIICCHVDDFLHSSDKFFDKMIEELRSRFYAGKLEKEIFKHKGLK